MLSLFYRWEAFIAFVVFFLLCGMCVEHTYACMLVYVFTRMRASVCRPRVDGECLPQLLATSFLKSGSLPESVTWLLHMEIRC